MHICYILSMRTLTIDEFRDQKRTFPNEEIIEVLMPDTPEEYRYAVRVLDVWFHKHIFIADSLKLSDKEMIRQHAIKSLERILSCGWFVNDAEGVLQCAYCGKKINFYEYEKSRFKSDMPCPCRVESLHERTESPPEQSEGNDQQRAD
jgi:hypothetical protein